ncbi:MAG: DUF1697 domain-containing protein [Bacteroidales bacterium]|jgi:uncharacterized protein (DUF1697 family)|nr:DUF1697 domain-containing protein [Bacteroidales bacterium]
MMTYIGLLKGINVGGKNIVKMAELKIILQKAGLTNIKTYIQSGNIIFGSELDENTLKSKIESEIKKEFGLSIPVVLRTEEEFKQIIKQNPFTEEEIRNAESNSESEIFYVSLSADNISDENIKKLKSAITEKEVFHINGRDIYFLFDKTIRNSKAVSILQKVDNTSTIRNWKTINKLMELAEPE